MSVSAAAIALGIVVPVAAAPAAKPSSSKAQPAKSDTKKDSKPKLSKWQQHIQDQLKVSAPGDEYFGRMKMSYLGINNTFHDDLIRAGAYTTDPHIISRISFADEALLDWAKKYPNDPQLARSYFLAFQMYRKVWTKEFQDKAWDYSHIVVKKWPGSFFGKTLKKDLQIGFTEHYFADPQPCATPTALPSGAVALSVPSSIPSPTPSPTPSPAPGRPNAEVLPAPCIAPTPFPTITPVPSPLPSGAITPTPAASTSPSPTISPAPGATTAPRATPTSAGPTTPGATPAPGATPSPAATPTHKP